jgi:hypothetical protein
MLKRNAIIEAIDTVRDSFDGEEFTTVEFEDFKRFEDFYHILSKEFEVNKNAFVLSSTDEKILLKDIIKGMDAVLDSFDGEEFSTVTLEQFDILDIVYLKLIK